MEPTWWHQPIEHLTASDSESQTAKAEFSLALAALAEVLVRSEPLTRAAIEAYWEDLGAYPLAEILPALRRLRRSQRYFPVPVEILDEIRAARRGRQEPRALPPAPPDPEEQATVRAGIRALIETLTAKFRPRASGFRDRPLVDPPSADEQAAHHRRQASARAALRTLPPREEKSA